MFVFISILIYILLIFVLSIKEKEIELSDFELQRRITAGEKRYERILLKKQIVPIYNRFRNFTSVILAVILVMISATILVVAPAAI